MKPRNSGLHSLACIFMHFPYNIVCVGFLSLLNLKVFMKSLKSLVLVVGLFISPIGMNSVRAEDTCQEQSLTEMTHKFAELGDEFGYFMQKYNENPYALEAKSKAKEILLEMISLLEKMIDSATNSDAYLLRKQLNEMKSIYSMLF